MPTITLSWTDLAVASLTVGLIATVAFVGSQQRAAPGSTSTPSASSGSGSKKKRSKAKRPASTPSPQPPSSLASSVAASSPPTRPTPPAKSEPAPPSREVTPQPPAGSKKGKKPDSGPSSGASDAEFPPLGAKSTAATPKRPLAERMQVKPRKTAVDDMIDQEVEKPVTMARVMRITEDPVASPSTTESEAEDGWEKVSKKPTRSGTATPTLTISATLRPVIPGSSASTSSAPTKKQRQNAAKKEAAKANKAADEAERLSRLAAHKRGLENVKMMQQQMGPPKSSSEWSVASGKKASGEKRWAVE